MPDDYEPTLDAYAEMLGDLSVLEPAGVAEVIGVHLEGPMLAEKYRGGHPVDCLSAPESVDLEAYVATNFVRMVTLAPELAGALPMISRLSERGVVVGIGHSDATIEEVDAGVEAGALWVTHLFNAICAR